MTQDAAQLARIARHLEAKFNGLPTEDLSEVDKNMTVKEYEDKAKRLQDTPEFKQAKLKQKQLEASIQFTIQEDTWWWQTRSFTWRGRFTYGESRGRKVLVFIGPCKLNYHFHTLEHTKWIDIAMQSMSADCKAEWETLKTCMKANNFYVGV